MANLLRASRALGERLQTKTKRGLLGREDGAIRATNGRYYVREFLSDNRLSPAFALPPAKNAQIPIRVNVAVVLGYDSTGQRVIISYDQQAATVQGIPPSVTNLADPQNQRILKDQLVFLRCRPSQTAGQPMYAEVSPDNFVIADTYYEWPGGSIDLSGAIPTAGNHRYTVVLWRESTNDLEIASSTAQSTGTPLDDTDIQQAIDNANTDTIPLKAFVITATTTALDGSSAGCKDIRTSFNKSAGSGTVYYQLLRDGGSDQTQRNAINFVDGNGIDIVASDDAGNNETEVTITVNQSELTDLVPKSLFDANTVLKADSDNTPVALTMGASTILARLAAGNIVAATVAQIKTLLAIVVADIADIATTYANVALSNLASVAINTSLISDTDITDDLGSASIKWRNSYTKTIVVDEHNDPATPASGDLAVFGHSATKSIAWINSFGDTLKGFGGAIGSSVALSLTTSAQAIIAKIVEAGGMGTTGSIESESKINYFNNSGAGRTLTYTYNFGGYSFSVSILVAASATNRARHYLVARTINDQATNAQHHGIEWRYISPGAAATLANIVSQMTWDTSAVDTTADVDVNITVLSSAANATQTATGNGIILGPNYSA